MSSQRRARRPRRSQRGATYVELLIALVTVLTFFLSIWQLADACAAHLILKRAASAAVRAAVVVMPDMGKFYEVGLNEGVNTLDGKRGEDVQTAARLVLVASPHFVSTPSKVEISPQKPSGNQTVTATVTAQYQCFSSWVRFVCGSTGSLEMKASAKLPYQGVKFHY